MKGFGNGERGGKFYSPIVALGRVDDMIVNHEPMAVLAVSTTGIKEDDEVMRACLAVYKFNEKTYMYEEEAFFDKYRQVPEPILERASSEKEKASYDVFSNAGFTVEEYKERAIPSEDFEREMDKMLEAISDKAVLIVNGNPKFSKILENSGIALSDFRRENPDKFVYQNEVTKDFFTAYGVPEPQKSSLERLQSYLMPESHGSFVKNSDIVEILKSELEAEMRMEKFSDLNNEQKKQFIEYCCKNAHESGLGNDISSREIKATVEDLIKQENVLDNKLIGADERVRAISAFVGWRSQNLIYEQEQGKNSLAIWAIQNNREDEAIKAEMSAKGKEEYTKADIDKKYETLINFGQLNPEKIFAEESEYHKLKEAILNPEIDSICVIHASTSPMDNSKKGTPEFFGEPMMISAVTFTKEKDGTINGDTGEIFEIAVKVSKEASDFIALRKNSNKNYFDAFAYAGINEADYDNGFITGYDGNPLIVMDVEQAILHLEEFNRDKGKNCQFLEFGDCVRPSLARIGSPSIIDRDVIDLSKVVKDYSYLVSHSDEIEQNVVLDENAPNFRFSIEQIASFQGNSATNAFDKACVGAEITANLAVQIAEMEKEKHKDDIKETPAEDVIDLSNEVNNGTENQKLPLQTQDGSEIEYTIDDYETDNNDELSQEEADSLNGIKDPETENPAPTEDYTVDDKEPFEVQKSETFDKAEKEAEKEENRQMSLFGDNSEPEKETTEKKEETQEKRTSRRKKPAPEPVRNENSNSEILTLLAGIVDTQQKMLQEMKNDKETVNQQMMLLTSKMTEMVSSQMTAISVLVETNQKAFERCDTIIEQNNVLREENKTLKETIEQNGKRIAELEGRVEVLADMQEYQLDFSDKSKEQANPNINR